MKKATNVEQLNQVHVVLYDFETRRKYGDKVASGISRCSESGDRHVLQCIPARSDELQVSPRARPPARTRPRCIFSGVPRCSSEASANCWSGSTCSYRFDRLSSEQRLLNARVTRRGNVWSVAQLILDLRPDPAGHLSKSPPPLWRAGSSASAPVHPRRSARLDRRASPCDLPQTCSVFLLTHCTVPHGSENQTIERRKRAGQFAEWRPSECIAAATSRLAGRVD